MGVGLWRTSAIIINIIKRKYMDIYMYCLSVLSRGEQISPTDRSPFVVVGVCVCVCKINKIPWYTHCEGNSFHGTDGKAAIASIAGTAQYLMAVHWGGSTVDDGR